MAGASLLPKQTAQVVAPSNDGSVLLIHRKKINTFFGLRDLCRYNLTVIDLEDNDLEDFRHFGTHSELQELRLEGNQIASFWGLTKQKSLSVLRLKGNPICANANYRLMALLTAGFSLKLIDGAKVTSQEREMARRLGPNAALAVSYGWLLDLTPRTADEYDDIISQLRAARKNASPAHTTCISILTVLDELSMQTAESTAGAAATSAETDSVAGEAKTVYERALTHLSQRTAELQRQLAETQSALVREQMKHTLDPEWSSLPAWYNPRQSTCSGISVAELQHIERVTFARGIRATTNLQPAVRVSRPSSGSASAINCDVSPCAVVVDETHLALEQFFSRDRVVECRLDDIAEVDVDTVRQQMYLRTRQGGQVSHV